MSLQHITIIILAGRVKSPTEILKKIQTLKDTYQTHKTLYTNFKEEALAFFAEPIPKSLSAPFQQLLDRFYNRVGQKLYAKFVYYKKKKQYLNFLASYIRDAWTLNQLIVKSVNKDFTIFMELIDVINYENDNILELLMDLIVDQNLVASLDEFNCTFSNSNRPKLIEPHQPESSKMLEDAPLERNIIASFFINKIKIRESVRNIEKERKLSSEFLQKEFARQKFWPKPRGPSKLQTILVQPQLLVTEQVVPEEIQSNSSISPSDRENSDQNLFTIVGKGVSDKTKREKSSQKKNSRPVKPIVPRSESKKNIMSRTSGAQDKFQAKPAEIHKTDSSIKIFKTMFNPIRSPIHEFGMPPPLQPRNSSVKFKGKLSSAQEDIIPITDLQASLTQYSIKPKQVPTINLVPNQISETQIKSYSSNQHRKKSSPVTGLGDASNGRELFLAGTLPSLKPHNKYFKKKTEGASVKNLENYLRKAEMLKKKNQMYDSILTEFVDVFKNMRLDTTDPDGCLRDRHDPASNYSDFLMESQSFAPQNSNKRARLSGLEAQLYELGKDLQKLSLSDQNIVTLFESLVGKPSNQPLANIKSKQQFDKEEEAENQFPQLKDSSYRLKTSAAALSHLQKTQPPKASCSKLSIRNHEQEFGISRNSQVKYEIYCPRRFRKIHMS